jgi:predicted esterase
MTRTPIAALTLALAIAAALPAGAQARTAPKRAHLTVTAGRVQGASAARVAGSFVVTNTGTARSRRTTARLAVRVSSRRWTGFKSYRIPALAPRQRRTIAVKAVALPRRPKGRTLAVRVCVGAACRTVGSTKVPARVTPPPVAPPAPPTTTTAPAAPTPPAPTRPAPPIRPADTTPAHPIAVQPDTDVHAFAAGADYWLFVPDAYDTTHRTPSKLFVWLHGCYGDAQGDLDTYENDGQSYIMISLGGTDGGCWDVDADPARVMAAIADVEDKLNIDRRRVVIGGYSSGGDLSYRTAFYNAYTFSGLLALNTMPFRDTGSTAQQSLAAAAWKFNIVHLAHTDDEAYPIAGVKTEIGTLQQAGWNPTLIERPGTHHDANTETDVQTYLLPYLDANWTAP